jgi:hypothetical protein
MLHVAAPVPNALLRVRRSRFAFAALSLALLGWTAPKSQAQGILDGSFENQALAQGLPSYQTGPAGELWGRPWNNGWTQEGLSSSWRDIVPSGTWIGGQICRTEDFATGWKWAKTGVVFGIIKDRQVMSQTFTATENATGTLSWFDCNRNSWRGDTWFGRPNDYSVTLSDSLGNTQLIGNYTSQVFGGLEANSWNNVGDDRFLLPNKQGWFSRSGASFTLMAGMTYTLSFQSLSPYITDSNGNITGVDDRTTLLDDISISTTTISALPYCFGDGTGTPCPCGNHAPVGSGTGCLNSLGTGGLLTASGTASIGGDTLVLTGSGMPDSFVVYIQGTLASGSGAGTAFGDGKLCVTGSMMRLGTVLNSGGGSSVPNVSNPIPLSQRGGVTTSGIRNYQLYYRNPASFCTSGTFNLTNALSITWSL